MKTLWTIAGWIALGLGVIGIFLPLLPTTPFVLLAAFLFAKGSPRMRAWLVGHQTFGPIITEWETHGAIAPRYKAIACAMMAAVFIISLLASLPPTVLIIQFVCMSGAAAFILTRSSGPGHRK